MFMSSLSLLQFIIVQMDFEVSMAQGESAQVGFLNQVSMCSLHAGTQVY